MLFLYISKTLKKITKHFSKTIFITERALQLFIGENVLIFFLSLPSPFEDQICLARFVDSDLMKRIIYINMTSAIKGGGRARGTDICILGCVFYAFCVKYKKNRLYLLLNKFTKLDIFDNFAVTMDVIKIMEVHMTKTII